MNEICPICKEPKDDIERRRQFTYYRDDEKNFIISCHDCFIEGEEYWCEQHQEYIDMVMGFY